jgi:hypothetical protein
MCTNAHYATLNTVHPTMSGILTLVVKATDYTGNCKSNNHDGITLKEFFAFVNTYRQIIPQNIHSSLRDA